jgi:hypothetical protein
LLQPCVAAVASAGNPSLLLLGTNPPWDLVNRVGPFSGITTTDSNNPGLCGAGGNTSFGSGGSEIVTELLSP